MKRLGVAGMVLCLVTGCSASDDDTPAERDEQDALPSIPVDCSGRMTLTPEQWAECTAPRTGAHAVEARTCEGAPIAPAYRVEPALICRAEGHPSGELTSRCAIGPYCTSHAECTDYPRGRCTGVPSSNCDYGNQNLAQGCDRDDVCHPGGRCIETPFHPGTVCDPTGVCAPFPDRVCLYPESPCDDDSDCTAAPGGVCRKLIRHTACEYHGCLADADCGPGGRCACHTCVPSTCNGDQDCSAGQICRLGSGCWGQPTGFHCSSSEDTCVTSTDCRITECEFNGRSWQCGQEVCPPIE